MESPRWDAEQGENLTLQIGEFYCSLARSAPSASAAIGNLGDKFGLGFVVRSEKGLTELGSVGEYTWAGIYNTRFWIDPREELAIVMLAQIIPRKPEIEAKVHAAVYQALSK